jgi:peptide methionine sulfoxide reductase MsrA
LCISTRVGCVDCAGKENGNPTAGNNPGHAEVVEVIFDPGQTRDILELLSRSTSPAPGQEPVQAEAVCCG